MASDKFSEIDRDSVILLLEQNLGVSLRRLGSRRKYLQDSSGTRYCILGGKGNWHGIPDEIVEKEEQQSGDSVLVVAAPRARNFDVYIGSLGELIKNKGRLSRASNQYQFHFRIDGNQMKINEVPSLILSKLES